MATGPYGGILVPIDPQDQNRLQALVRQTVQAAMTEDTIRTQSGDAAENDPATLAMGPKIRMFSGVLRAVTAHLVIIKTPDGRQTLPYREEFYSWRVGGTAEQGSRWIDSLIAGGETFYLARGKSFIHIA